MASAPDHGVRVRFCPSPTGNPHVGLVRTALFNWAFARHTAAPSSSASRTPTPRATPRSRTSSCWTRCAGSASTGTRAPRSAARTRPYRQSQRMDIYADVAEEADGRRPRLPLLLHHRGARRPPRRRPRRRQALRLRRPLPRADRRADGGVRGRGPRPDRPLPDARRADHLHRPGPRRADLHPGERARLRHRPRQRRPAVHAGQPGRRRADGDHPRPARRGPAVLHPPPDRALQGADRAGRRQGRSPPSATCRT